MTENHGLWDVAWETGGRASYTPAADKEIKHKKRGADKEKGKRHKIGKRPRGCCLIAWIEDDDKQRISELESQRIKEAQKKICSEREMQKPDDEGSVWHAMLDA